jgi:hypothetical protein
MRFFYRNDQRLQLLCCGCSLSAVAIRLAFDVASVFSIRVQHKVVAQIIRHYFSVMVRRIRTNYGFGPSW